MQRLVPRALLLVAAATAGLVGCGAASKAAGEKMLDLAEGRWTCRSSGEETIELTVGDDGSFTLQSTDEPGERPERATGEWTVVDRDVQISAGGTVARIIRGDGLGIDAGSITVETRDPRKPRGSDEVVRLRFELAVTGTDTVTITPTGEAAKLFPSGARTCTR